MAATTMRTSGTTDRDDAELLEEATRLRRRRLAMASDNEFYAEEEDD
jgi:hypothetical protein